MLVHALPFHLNATMPSPPQPMTSSPGSPSMSPKRIVW